MTHPNGGSGIKLVILNSFEDVFHFVGSGGARFLVGYNHLGAARQEAAKGPANVPTIAFGMMMQGSASACMACWGYSHDCNGAPIKAPSLALDDFVTVQTKLSRPKVR